jgi:sigma-B regulation protein RsbU (phosphoserine phosphatase)
VSAPGLLLRRRLALAAPAALFSAWALLYTVSLLLAAQPQSQVELGFTSDFRVAEQALVVTEVSAASPAQQAGLAPGDRIVAVDGLAIENDRVQPDAWMRHKAGDRVRLIVRRRGIGSPLVLTGTFRWSAVFGDATYIAKQVQTSYPVPFVVIGIAVLFLRLEDRNAWLLALLFGSFATIQEFPGGFDAMAPSLRPVLFAYRALWLGLLGALFYGFFAVFPARSPIDRRVPWLKWVGVAVGLTFGLPALVEGPLRLPAPLAALVGDNVSVALPRYYELLFLTLGLVSLAGNYAAARDPQALRRIRVVFWGTVVGLTPGLVAYAAQLFAHVAAGSTLDTFIAGALYLIPLSFAYAVVRHRVLDIPVLLRRSARYLLVQRGFTIVLSLASIGLTLGFGAWVAPRLISRVPLTPASGVALGAVFGTVLLWGGAQVHRRVSARIDRAFFRAAYDAQLIFEDLAEQLRFVTSRRDLAVLLQRHLDTALKPRFLVVYLPGEGPRFDAVSDDVPAGLESLSADLPIVVEVAGRGSPLETSVAAEVALGLSMPPGPSAPARESADPECLVPILTHDRRLLGLVLVGPRRSEEPYSRDDTRLLTGVAGQAGIALENIRLAEEIAARLERERREAREMDIAREVQRRLLPQNPPVLRTLTCAAQCLQARSVGGDFFDFIDLGSTRAGFVLADVSGKGVHAALLSASLQALLRSQCATALRDPVAMLALVNGMLFRSTAPQHYATVFFAVYDDETRHFTYVCCGHNPPICLRNTGTVERLRTTAPAVGLFEEWAGAAGDILLGPGDVVVVFSDGVTDATQADLEFGEARLVAELEANPTASPEDMVSRILESVQAFSTGQQFDDLTLLVVRGREAAA